MIYIYIIYYIYIYIYIYVIYLLLYSVWGFPALVSRILWNQLFDFYGDLIDWLA